MNVISRRGVGKLIERHPETQESLLSWYRLARKAARKGLHHVRGDIRSADQAGNVLIFDFLGGNYRLITTVNYHRQVLFVKALLTHRQYDRKDWMKWA